MKGKKAWHVLWLMLFVFWGTLRAAQGLALQNNTGVQTVIKLPQPDHESGVSLEAAVKARKSSRSYQAAALTLAEVSQLLWAAQGVTRKNGMRTAPSAGALYPLEVYLEVDRVEQLAAGVYKYRPQSHELVQISDQEKRRALTAAGLGQGCIARGAVNIILAAVYERTAVKYGDRAVRYVHMEAGHAAQNIYLQAVVLGLGTVAGGAFDDHEVKKVLLFQRDEYPLYIMPVGRVR